MNHVADRINKLEIPKTIAMTKMARELRAQGKDVISLSLGEPDFDTPDYIKAAAQKGMEENYTHYMPVKGYADLREVISKKFKRDNGLDYSPDQIVVSTGAKQSISNIILSLVNNGDEVIIPAPYWVSYYEQTKLAGGKQVIVKTDYQNNFKITPEQLRNAMTSKTKLMIFSTPNNPSGAMYSQEELDALAEVICEKEDFYVVCDEIYELINYTGKKASLAKNPKVYEQVITVNGLSKGFAMTGWRLGYIGAPRWIADACDKIQSQFTSGASSISQRAAMAALGESPEKVQYMVDTFRERRDLLAEKLNAIDGFEVKIPEGAFYVFPYVQEIIDNSELKDDSELAEYILKNALVASVPGSAFGLPGYIRFSYAAKTEELEEAASRVRACIEQLLAK
ncbi:MAG: pyridoxal phosphate-dependent aminotransferase [Schleiferiaceae bacterium]|nr:pyridoxal phosphate-dependent aminotransferase [Schleiferiaceae bacterium]